jgi:glycosyltransferase involved in cell wall biosynthesis
VHATILVPPIHDRPTGGNIYNRRVAAAGGQNGGVTVVPWRPDAEEADPPGGDTVVVDSLLVRHEEALRALRRARPAATLVLLAHYLHCIDPTEREAPAAAAERAVLPLFDGVVTTSDYARRALADEGVPAARIAVVPPGLDDAYRAPVPDRAGREGPPRLLTVASLLPGKRLPALVDGLGTLTDADWTWTLVGDDTLAPDVAEAVRARIRGATIADRVTLTGPVPAGEMRAQYDDADVFVLPSRFETCSMATREALARGLPVVAYAVGGVPDNLGSSGAGHLVPPGPPGALVDALRPLLTDPEARARMGRAARERSQRFPSWTATAERFRAALKALGNAGA